MTQLPPPPPWGGPPGNYPYPTGPPGPPPSGPSNKARFWIGVALAVPAMLAAGAVTALVAAVADSASASSDLSSVVGGLTSLLILAGYVAMLVHPKTRWVAIGMLAGAAVALILAAGACVVLLLTVMGSYN